MRFANERGLAASLEAALGNHHPLASAFDASLRLRMGMCGSVSVAVADALRRTGIYAETVHSKPMSAFDPDYEHVMVRATYEGDSWLIDPTYSQFLRDVGLSAGYVFHGGQDLFPEMKVAVVRSGEGHHVAARLADAAEDFRRQREPIEALAHAPYALRESSHSDLFEAWEPFWNPVHFERHTFDDDNVMIEGLKMGRYIVPHHIQLVD
ncbi:MAG TPA: hypothetical protein QF549_03625 [Candidatus Saccharimonadaceae bacterium]|nr:hypothetical protein [Candidatus Saccharimonadaceae bacterium]|tara:strand:+ start:198 stop:824 length:627 start_codon:yes stop_codon:yes gene_type:complete